MRPTIVFPIAMIALSLLAIPAGATITYYTDQSAWAAATSGVFTEDFEGISVDYTGYVDYTSTGLHLLDVDFTDNGTLWVIHTPSAASYYTLGTRQLPSWFRLGELLAGRLARGSHRNCSRDHDT